MKEFLLAIIGAIIDALKPPERRPEEEPDLPTPPVPVPDPEKPPPAEEDTQPPDSAFVWKPISDGDGRLAIITPYQYEFSSVHVETTKGKIERGRYIGRGNGHRQAWRFSKRGRAYGKKVRVVCVGEGIEKEWIVPDGANRYESRNYAP